MKVFISWSGERSRVIAKALRDWIPNVIQSVGPWVSAEDIDKGLRWSSEIAVELKDTTFGIICLTPDNLDAPWIMFEAGALSKTLDKAFVCPLLFGVEPSEVKGPLTQFQATRAEKDDMRKLVQTINRACGDGALAADRIDKAFEHWWPDLEQAIRDVPSTGAMSNPQRSEIDLLQEILEIVRAEARESQSFSKTRDDSMSHAAGLLRFALGENPNAPAEVRMALKLLRPAVKSGAYRRRKHRAEGMTVSARAMALSDGKWRAEVAEPEGEDRLDDWFFDCETMEIAQNTADSLVQEAYPHTCGKEQCGAWGAVLVRGRSKGTG